LRGFGPLISSIHILQTKLEYTSSDLYSPVLHSEINRGLDNEASSTLPEETKLERNSSQLTCRVLNLAQRMTSGWDEHRRAVNSEELGGMSGYSAPLFSQLSNANIVLYVDQFQSW